MTALSGVIVVKSLYRINIRHTGILETMDRSVIKCSQTLYTNFHLPQCFNGAKTKTTVAGKGKKGGPVKKSWGS